uniref:Movement protein n=1 Tax=Gentiana ophiovirus TaxID=2983943 RepID=A0A9N7AB50_9VIRU|nr:TPA_asm: movement protein [Gentiana ophiovirus]
MDLALLPASSRRLTLGIDQTESNRAAKGKTKVINISGDDDVSDEIESLAADFAKMATDKITSCLSPITINLKDGFKKQKLQLTSMQKVHNAIKTAVNKIGGSEDYPFITFEKVQILYIPLFANRGECDGEITVTLSDEGAEMGSAQRTIQSVKFNAGKEVIVELSMDFFIAKKNVDKVVVEIESEGIPIIKRAYAAMTIGFFIHESYNPLLMLEKPTMIVCMEPRVRPKDTNRKTILRQIGEDLKREQILRGSQYKKKELEDKREYDQKNKGIMIRGPRELAIARTRSELLRNREIFSPRGGAAFRRRSMEELEVEREMDEMREEEMANRDRDVERAYESEFSDYAQDNSPISETHRDLMEVKPTESQVHTLVPAVTERSLKFNFRIFKNPMNLPFVLDVTSQLHVLNELDVPHDFKQLSTGEKKEVWGCKTAGRVDLNKITYVFSEAVFLEDPEADFNFISYLALKKDGIVDSMREEGRSAYLFKDDVIILTFDTGEGRMVLKDEAWEKESVKSG